MVVELKEHNRKMAATMEMFPDLAYSYVISNDGSGNPIALDLMDKLLMFDYDTCEQKRA